MQSKTIFSSFASPWYLFIYLFNFLWLALSSTIPHALKWWDVLKTYIEVVRMSFCCVSFWNRYTCECERECWVGGLRIADQCPVLCSFQNMRARLIELHLVASEVLYIKCACLPVRGQAEKIGMHIRRVCICVCLWIRVCKERKADRQVCMQSVCLIRSDGLEEAVVDNYRWLSSLMLFLNERLCSLVSETHSQISIHIHTHSWLHLHGHKRYRNPSESI